MHTIQLIEHKAMEELEIPEQLISMTRASMKNVVCKLKTDGHLTENFPAEKRLRQGMLFLVYCSI